MTTLSERYRELVREQAVRLREIEKIEEEIFRSMAYIRAATLQAWREQARPNHLIPMKHQVSRRVYRMLRLPPSYRRARRWRSKVITHRIRKETV